MINIFFAATTIVGLALPMLPAKSASAERHLYWTGALVATGSAFLALFPPDWRGGLALAGALAGGLTLRAYMSTPYLRIRGRTYAFNLRNSDPDEADADSRQPVSDSDHDPAPDSYGGFARAPKAWWLLVIVISACAFIFAIFVVKREGPWYAVGAVAAVTIIAISIGHQDGSWDYRFARGQLVQYCIAGITTLGVFAALYYFAYLAGRRWPLRPQGSMEYRAHPHLQRKFPK